jgi:hypothetical protein
MRSFYAQPRGVSAGFPTVAYSSRPAPGENLDVGEIPLGFVFLDLPFGSMQTITVPVWDASMGCNLVIPEVNSHVKFGFPGECDFVRCWYGLLNCRGER